MEMGKTDNSSRKQGIPSEVSEMGMATHVLLRSSASQWDDAAGTVLPEWSEGSSRWGKLPLPFSIFFKVVFSWFQAGCSGDPGCMPASSLGAND